MLAAKFIVAKPVYLTSRTPARCGKRAPRAILGGRSSVAEPSGPQTKSPYDSIRAGLFWRLGFYLGIGADFGRSDNGRTPRFSNPRGSCFINGFRQPFFSAAPSRVRPSRLQTT